MYTTPITSMRQLIIHMIRVAFFFEKEERISRGEYWVGKMVTIFIWGTISLIVHLVIDSLIVSVIIFIIFYLITHINLMVKRAHDLDMSGRRVAALLVPGLNVYLMIMFGFSPAYNENNRFGDDPLKHIPSNNVGYRAVCIALYVSYVFIQISPNFVGIVGRLGTMTSSRVPEPDAIMNPYTTMNNNTASYNDSSE